MSNSYFFLSPIIKKTEKNRLFLEELELYSESNALQIYALKSPLGENKYSYDINDSFVLLIPKHKIIFINFGSDEAQFNTYIEDFIEDLGSLSDKFRYKDFIGRPREWREEVIESVLHLGCENVLDFISHYQIKNDQLQRKCELIISLLTGSINDIEKIKADVPETILDKVKQKIVLFDGDQTRFVYDTTVSPGQSIRIQGLSGTGKTELLLHKLKELYVNNPNSRIMFTCHNKVLSNSLKTRIPNFFNFMKVEEQIDWNNRLWCVHGWGSQYDKNSGAYRYICSYYDIPFHRFSNHFNYNTIWKIALEQINQIPQNHFTHAFDFMLIDESQDFPDSFFELCEKITKTNVFIAGDIFQSIFDTRIVSSIQPDYLLSKCYRTDPRTLMFAHALGMGLFEKEKLRWLSDEEWKACGYKIEESDGSILLSREPLRRFEDIDYKSHPSMELVPVRGQYSNAIQATMDILQNIVKENRTVEPHDIGIIFLDSGKEIYSQADILEQEILTTLNWKTNKSYESKSQINGHVFVTNINNVKGLEFPFVICIGSRLDHNRKFRNALYTMLTRSFLQSYLILSSENDTELSAILLHQLNRINESGEMLIQRPSPDEEESLRTAIEVSNKPDSITFYDFVHNVMTEYGIAENEQESIYESIKAMMKEHEFDEEKIIKIIDFTVGLNNG